MLLKEEFKHYDRQLILPEIGQEGQQKLKGAKVLVVGAGGLGCPILQYLSAAGVGTLGIIDDDVVSVSNLHRQILYTYDDVGKHKAKVAVAKLSRLNPLISFKVFTEKLTNKNALEVFNKFDIIVDGTDNFQTRYLINDACVLSDKPLVSGSIFKFEGQVSVFNYKNGPTYRCLFPNPPKPNSVPNCAEIGVLGVLAGIIGCFQANEVIKIICGIGNILSGKLLTYNVLNVSQNVFKIRKNENLHITKLEDNYDFFCGFLDDLKEVTYTKLNENIKEYNLLDVRTLQERAEFQIGGMHIPLNELKQRFNEISTEKPLVVYCKSGNRSKQAIKILQNLNFPSEIFNLKNGVELLR